MIYAHDKGLGDVIEEHDDVKYGNVKKEAGSRKTGSTGQGRTCVWDTTAVQQLTSTTAVHMKCALFGSSRLEQNTHTLANCIALCCITIIISCSLLTVMLTFQL